MKTAKAVEQPPWNLIKAAAYLRQLVKDNLDVRPSMQLSVIGRHRIQVRPFSAAEVGLHQMAGYDEFAPNGVRQVQVHHATAGEINRRLGPTVKAKAKAKAKAAAAAKAAERAAARDAKAATQAPPAPSQAPMAAPNVALPLCLQTV